MSALPHYCRGTHVIRRGIVIGLSWSRTQPAWLGYIFNVGIGKTVGGIFHAPRENAGTLCLNCSSSLAMIVVLVQANHLRQWGVYWFKGIEVWVANRTKMGGGGVAGGD